MFRQLAVTNTVAAWDRMDRFRFQHFRCQTLDRVLGGTASIPGENREARTARRCRRCLTQTGLIATHSARPVGGRRDGHCLRIREVGGTLRGGRRKMAPDRHLHCQNGERGTRTRVGDPKKARAAGPTTAARQQEVMRRVRVGQQWTPCRRLARPTLRPASAATRSGDWEGTRRHFREDLHVTWLPGHLERSAPRRRSGV